jgi:hypothetical protein
LEWVASVSGTVSVRGAAKDVADKQHSPDPIRAACNETNEEAGVDLLASQLKWIGFGVGLRMGTPCLLGEVEIDRSEDEVLKDFENREDKRETKAVKFVALEPEPVSEILQDEKNFKHKSYFELGLALALIRRGKAERLRQ